MRVSTDYVELEVRSCFSFLRGASPPSRLVARAAELGHDAIALTDVGGLYGIVRAMEACEEHGVRLVVGCELGCVLLHVENHAGYTNLCRALGKAHELDRDLESRARTGILDVEHLAANAEGLFCTLLPEHALTDLSALKDAFGPRLSLAVRRSMDGSDAKNLRAALALGKKWGIPLVATGGVRFASPEEKPVLDVLHCIGEGITLDDAGRGLLPNAERCLRTHAATRARFSSRPELLARSREIADACRFSMRELRYRFPCELDGISSGESADKVLREATYAGARARYGVIPDKVRALLEKELALIAELEVAPYFLTVWDVVNMARRRDILCQGRGSAANSAVCFSLGITAVDPARSSLLFERFLSPERREPPDIDVDFEHERREEVIQDIYAKYGRDRAAMVSEVICYRGRSALKEVGKVFGLSLEQVERLSSLVTWWDGAEVPAERLRAVGFDPKDERVLRVISLAGAIQGFPRHLSIHVGGFVLSATSLAEIAPVQPATMPGRTVVPWDKDDIDVLGFFKMDVLGLGMLTAIRKSLDLLPGNDGASAIDRLAKIPAEDPRVYDALCKADTVGVFQIESRAQMSMLPRLAPRSFYDLVIEVAIVRPGPIQGGMVHPYLRRRSGEEPIDYPHEALVPILERTLGVPLFQEQVMQIAIVGAGYTGGEADQLRRDMAAWRRNGRLERHKERLRAGFLARGISEAFAERLYAQIQGFGEYGFPESHAASFALLVYASAWLKVHHPAAFAAALVNSQPMGFYSVSTLFEDARRHGVRVLSPCIVKSDWDCTLEDERTIRSGLRLIKGLGEERGRHIVRARANRPFDCIEDLAARASLDKKELASLAESGALEPIVQGRRNALWKVLAPRAEGLFEAKDEGGEPPRLAPLTKSEQLVLDFERTGTSPTHPMQLLRPGLSHDIVGSRQIASAKDGARAKVAGLVICRQRPGTASGVVFMTLEDEHGFINLVLYARVFDHLRVVATQSPLVLAEGRVQREGDVVHLVAQNMRRLAIPTQQRDLGRLSRDFH